jgi:hypothetical protein
MTTALAPADATNVGIATLLASIGQLLGTLGALSSDP